MSNKKDTIILSKLRNTPMKIDLNADVAEGCGQDDKIIDDS